MVDQKMHSLVHSQMQFPNVHIKGPNDDNRY